METIRIRAGLLVDGTGTPPVRDGAVLVRGDRIVEAGPAAAVPAPPGAARLEFPDLTLLPGLVDCHSHLNLPGDGTTIEQAMADGDDLLLLRSAENARAALESGVTSLRDNGAFHRTAGAIREAIRRGIVRGPRLSISGRPVTVTRGHCWPFGGEADGVDGVRRAVRALLEEGVDWIKVMVTGGGTLDTDQFRAYYGVPELRAAVEEAHAAGKLTAAHALCTAGIVNALDAGFDMIVHGFFYESDGRYVFRPDLARRIADQGVWVNPTTHVGRSRIWRLQRLAEARPLTDEETVDLASQRRTYEERCQTLHGLLQAGVRLAAGSDSGWSYYAFGGFAHEIDAMAEAGMGAAAALRAGTLDAARAMGVDRDAGSVERDKLADLLLVEGDPTTDTAAIRRVAAVFLGGKRLR
jgi:imidazolonepropionase-like amidohydrolase